MTPRVVARLDGKRRIATRHAIALPDRDLRMMSIGTGMGSYWQYVLDLAPCQMGDAGARARSAAPLTRRAL
jgi:hypothetical protein